MGYRMNDKDWDEVMACDKADHRIARMLSEEYAWGWATCWFSETGEFGHAMMRADPTHTDDMIRGLFTWWQIPDGREVTDRDRKAQALMAAYLQEREANGDVGPVEGFRELWPTDR